MSNRIIADPSQHGWVLENGKWVWGASGGVSAGGVLISDTEPTSKTDGMMWMDTSIAPARIWIWDFSKWIELPFSGGGAPSQAREITGLEYLVIGGGGSGGTSDGARGGGGGSGGYRTNVIGDTTGGNSTGPEDPYPTVPIGTRLRVTVGLGGVPSGTFGAANGNSSLLDADGAIKKIESLYGGAGGNNGTNPVTGGSGGGAFSFYACSTASGTPGQGWAGGKQNAGNYGASGGGGAAGPGETGNGNDGGNGGPGIVSSIDGLNKSRAGGGGGGFTSGGGLGNSGSGNGSSGDGNPAQANTGSGGGGSNTSAGAGGSGVVIVRYPGDQAADGGDITSYNGYTVHTFNSSGTFEVWS